MDLIKLRVANELVNEILKQATSLDDFKPNIKGEDFKIIFQTHDGWHSGSLILTPEQIKGLRISVRTMAEGNLQSLRRQFEML